MILIGLDVGGTKIEGHLYEFHPFKADAPPFFLKVNAPNGRDYVIKILSQKRIPTDREKGYDHVLNNMKELCQDLVKELPQGIKAVGGIGIGLPGTVDPEAQEMLNGNTSLFVGKNLVQDLQYALDLNTPIKLANDANCFVLAEVMAGVGPRHFQITGKKVMDQIGLGIILGTGVGGGIVYEGKCLVGKRGGFGEFGHSVLVSGEKGRECFCPTKGHAESYLSGPGLLCSYQEKYQGELDPGFTSKDIFELAENGDSLSREVIQNYKDSLTEFLVNLVNLYDPDYFVLGGGVSLQNEIYQGLEEEVAKRSFIPENYTPIYKHIIGDSAGVLGAAFLAL